MGSVGWGLWGEIWMNGVSGVKSAGMGSVGWDLCKWGL